MADTPGVIQQARAQAPAATGQQPAQPVTAPLQPAAAPAAPAQPGFGQPAPQSGFTPQPMPVQPAAPEPQPAAIQTDNTRTSEQFEKLTNSNQRLAQTNELLRQELQRVQQANQPAQFGQPQQYGQQPAQQQPQYGQQQYGQQVPTGQPSATPKLQDYIEIDPQTGERFVNEQKFNAAMGDMYQRSLRAEQVVQNYVQTAEQREADRQFREAFSNYPQLNPQGGQFDGRFAQQARAIVYDSMINPQDYNGRSLSYKDAADFVAQAGTAGLQQRAVAPATATPQVNEANQVQKEQAAAQAQSTPPQQARLVDSDRELTRQDMDTRTGHDEAIAFRLSLTPHRLADLESQQIARQQVR